MHPIKKRIEKFFQNLWNFFWVLSPYMVGKNFGNSPKSLNLKEKLWNVLENWNNPAPERGLWII